MVQASRPRQYEKHPIYEAAYLGSKSNLLKLFAGLVLGFLLLFVFVTLHRVGNLGRHLVVNGSSSRTVAFGRLQHDLCAAIMGSYRGSFLTLECGRAPLR